MTNLVGKIQVREITKTEYPVLEDFLYNAIYIPDGEEWPPREIIFEPEIYVYVKDFGLDSDCGVVAVRNGTITGAAWTRIIPAYGHIDNDTPELAISVLPECRGQGVGTMLMNRLFDLLRERGYKRTSLSVQQNNPAVRFYERLGYTITEEKLDHAGHEDYIMVKNLQAMPHENEELEIVKQLTGINDESRIERNEIGWTSRVYIIDGGKIVFKFPRNPKFREECKNEVAALKLIKGQNFSLGVPVLNWTTDDNSYFGFYGVTGTPLREVIDGLRDEQKTEIGAQIGKFLRQLHGIKNCGDIKAQTLEEQALEYQNWYRKGRNLLTAYFSETELLKIDEFFTNEVPECMVGTNELVFCHGDLDYNNTLIDGKNQVGVIDFGDAGLYDRSQDFRGMDDELLRESMMKAYGSDEVISKTASITTSKMIDVLNLIYCIENNFVDGVDTINNCLKQVRQKILKDEV